MELKWRAQSWRCDTADGTYRVNRLSEACAELKYYPRGERRVCIDCVEGDERLYWPSTEMAQLAAQQHYERMRTTGETPDVAASRIPTDPAWYEAKMGETP